MPTHHSRDRTWYGPGRYLIRVQGSLRASWSDRLGGMRITPDEDRPNCTVLEGTLLDQAALMGVLDGLYGLGLPLLLVECVEGEEAQHASETVV